jgi:uncharacterized protein (TIGR02270 family)
MPFIDLDLLREHAEEAAFLWRLRHVMVRRANQRLSDLAEHDERIEAHLDGLRLAGPQGWEIAHALLLESPDGGAAFVAAQMASEPLVPAIWLAAVSTALIAEPILAESVIAGLTWSDTTRACQVITAWNVAESAVLREVAIGVAVAAGADASNLIRDACTAANARLRCAGLRAIGRLGRRQLRTSCQRALQDAEPDCRAAAVWSLAMIGGDHNTLRAQAERGGAWEVELTILAASRLPRAAVMEWINDHRNLPANLRRSLILAAHHGDIVVVPWIIKRMQIPALARLAGAAFAQLTGLDLEDAGLVAAPPKNFHSGPTDNPADGDVAPDPDEYLPWPDAVRITAWWEQHRAKLPENVRLLLGHPLTPEHLDHVLCTGTQPQRLAAAIERAVQTGRPLFDVEAPADRQKHALVSAPSVAGNEKITSA